MMASQTLESGRVAAKTDQPRPGKQPPHSKEIIPRAQDPLVGGGYAGFYTAWKLEKHLRQVKPRSPWWTRCRT